MTGGRLVVCPTPIGNLEDVTLRVLSALRDADVVACEDTRRTRVLLERYGVQATLISYHEHNERERAAELVERMRDGAVVALVSDAGMPLVSRPRLRARAGLRGGGARGRGAAGAVGGAGRAGRVGAARRGVAVRRASCRASAPRCVEVLGSPETVVAFESPKRVGASLAVLAELDGSRPVAVCRELTKVHEEVVRGTAGRAGGALRVGGRAARSCSSSAARRRGRGSTRRRSTPCAGWSTRARKARVAARVVADLTGAPANALYREVAESLRPDLGDDVLREALAEAERKPSPA